MKKSREASMIVLKSMKPKIDEIKDLLTFEGKVYDWYVAENSAYATFKLNYDEDFYVNVFVDSNNLKKISNAGAKIKEQAYVEVKGYLEWWAPKENKDNKYNLQINARAIFPDEYAINYYCAPNAVPKALPEHPIITLISNEVGAGTKDFMRALGNHSDIIVEKKSVTLEGKDALSVIPAVIKSANDSNNTNLICIVRGGGNSVGIRYIFDNQFICEAIRNSKIPVLVGVGHTEDFTNADRASDAPLTKNGSHSYFITPTALGLYLKGYYYKKNKVAEAVKTVDTVVENKVDVISPVQQSFVDGISNKYLIAIIVVLLLYIVFVK